MKRFLSIFLALGLLLGGAGQASADYIFTTLDGVVAHGINDSGDIVGGYEISGSYLYSGGTYTPINVPSSFGTLAWGINNARQVVGLYDDANSVHGFLLSAGSYTRIDVPGAIGTFAYGINNAGQIVGTYKGPHSTVADMGFLLDGGTFSTIVRPGAPYTRVGAINDRGQILGDKFLLSQDRYTTIHYPGSVDSYAVGINNAGQIVGSYGDRTGQHGFLLSDGVYSSIDFPGSTGTSLLGINNADQIVGSYIDAAGNPHAFLATPVPEPSTLLALILGVTSLLCWAFWRCTGATPGRGTAHSPVVAYCMAWLTPMLKGPPAIGNVMLKKSCGRPPRSAEAAQKRSGAHQVFMVVMTVPNMVNAREYAKTGTITAANVLHPLIRWQIDLHDRSVGRCIAAHFGLCFAMKPAALLFGA